MVTVRLERDGVYVGDHRVAHIDFPVRGFVRLWRENEDAVHDVEVWVFPTLRIVFRVEDGLPQPVLCQSGETLIEVSPDGHLLAIEAPEHLQVWIDLERETVWVENIHLYLNGLKEAFRVLFPDAFPD